jgi:hypothetical protein
MADRLYAQLGRLSDAYDNVLASQSLKAVRDAWGMWSTLTPSDWWNDGVTQGFASNLAYRDIVRTQALRRFGQSTGTQTLKLLGSGKVDPVDLSWAPTRANTDPWKVALKPVEQYRHMAMQSPDVKPLTFPKPTEADWKLVNSWLDSAQNRLETVTDADAVRAGEDGMRSTYKRAGVTYYRRVIHPELSKTGTCGLCAVAATQVYKISSPKPMHDRCHCTVMPILGDHDPGAYLNNLDLNKLYRKAGGTDAEGLYKLRVQVTQHGELGPVLNEHGHTARDTGYKADSPTQKFNQAHYKQPDRDTARMELESMLERSERLVKIMRMVDESGQSDRLVLDDDELNIRPSKSLKTAIRYQLQFAKQLRAMLHMAA